MTELQYVAQDDGKIKVALVGMELDLIDLIESIPRLKFVGIIDSTFLNERFGFSILGTDQDWEKIKKTYPDLKLVLAVDSPKIKVQLVKYYGENVFFDLSSPFNYIAKRAVVGVGTVIQRGVTIMPDVRIGDFCKINVNALIHHEAKIGNFCTISPGSQILGNVVIDDEVYVGAGAIIRQRCRIGKGAVIGAGAVVVTDIPSYTTVIGVPAKEMIKKANHNGK